VEYLLVDAVVVSLKSRSIEASSRRAFSGLLSRYAVSLRDS